MSIESLRLRPKPDRTAENRLLASEIMTGFFPATIVGDRRPLTETERLIREGYGIIAVYNHFGKREHISFLAEFVKNSPTIRENPMASPIALHQNSKGMRFLRWLSGFELIPIVTRHTKEKYEGQEDKLPDKRMRREMFVSYITSIRKRLRKGGLVAVAPQGGRAPKLGLPPDGKPIEKLLFAETLEIDESEVIALDPVGDKVAVLFVGIQIPGATKYERKNGRPLRFNTLKDFQIKLTGPITREKLLEWAGGDSDQVDQVVFDQLAEIVAKEYL